MPGDSGVTVVTNARVYYTPRAAAGASSARHSLRPLISESGTLIAKLGREARRDREAVAAEIGSGRCNEGPALPLPLTGPQAGEVELRRIDERKPSINSTPVCCR